MSNSIRIFILYFINFIFGLIEVLLTLRFVLKLFGASETSTFVNWVYANTEGIIHPFEGAFPTSVLKGGFIIEFSALLAIIVYGLIAYLITNFLSAPTANSSATV